MVWVELQYNSWSLLSVDLCRAGYSLSSSWGNCRKLGGTRLPGYWRWEGWVRSCPHWNEYFLPLNHKVLSGHKTFSSHLTWRQINRGSADQPEPINLLSCFLFLSPPSFISRSALVIRNDGFVDPERWELTHNTDNISTMCVSSGSCVNTQWWSWFLTPGINTEIIWSRDLASFACDKYLKFKVHVRALSGASIYRGSPWNMINISRMIL